MDPPLRAKDTCPAVEPAQSLRYHSLRPRETATRPSVAVARRRDCCDLPILGVRDANAREWNTRSPHLRYSLSHATRLPLGPPPAEQVAIVTVAGFADSLDIAIALGPQMSGVSPSSGSQQHPLAARSAQMKRTANTESSGPVTTVTSHRTATSPGTSGPPRRSGLQMTG